MQVSRLPTKRRSCLKSQMKMKLYQMLLTCRDLNMSWRKIGRKCTMNATSSKTKSGAIRPKMLQKCSSKETSKEEMSVNLIALFSTSTTNFNFLSAVMTHRSPRELSKWPSTTKSSKKPWKGQSKTSQRRPSNRQTCSLSSEYCARKAWGGPRSTLVTTSRCMIGS